LPIVFLIRFMRGHSPYQAGEVAGFAPATAHRLVKDGIAELVDSAPPKAVEIVKTGPPVDKMQRPAVTKRPVDPVRAEKFRSAAERAQTMVRDGVAVDEATALAIDEPRPETVETDEVM
jgi:hypothetical protein